MTREHWLQILALAITGGMMIGSATWLLSSQISGVRADSASATATLASKIAADEMRISAMENLEREHHADDLASRTAIGQQLNEVIRGLAQLQVDVAKSHR